MLNKNRHSRLRRNMPCYEQKYRMNGGIRLRLTARMSDKNRISAGLLTFGLFVILLSQIPSPGHAQEGESDYAEKGAETCLACHKRSPVTLIFNTPHAQKADPRTPFAGHECEACHGASPEHVKSLDSPAVVFGEKTTRFDPSPTSKQNTACLNCHESDMKKNRAGSQHQFGDVSCASCHTIHSQDDRVRSK